MEQEKAGCCQILLSSSYQRHCYGSFFSSERGFSQVSFTASSTAAFAATVCYHYIAAS
jgi:hypothetical protein